MTDTIIELLSWAIPSGGIGAGIAWIANRRLRELKTVKEVHDTYKEMYTDISAELEKLQKKNDETAKKIEELTAENGRTRRALNRLSRAIEAIQLCPYREACPVRGELNIDGSGNGVVGDELRERKEDCGERDEKRESGRQRGECSGEAHERNSDSARQHET